MSKSLQVNLTGLILLIILHSQENTQLKTANSLQSFGLQTEQMYVFFHPFQSLSKTSLPIKRSNAS